MKFLIIIPAHNEAKFVPLCLESLAVQTFRSFEVIVVNDGSSDGTREAIEKFIVGKKQFRLLNLNPSTHEPGAKVVRTFNSGLNFAGLDGVDVVCKFDADIIFPPNYLAELAEIYTGNPEAGMVSGIVKITKAPFDISTAQDFSNKNQQWIFEDISSKNHVRGPVKSYRKDCFTHMNGLREVLGWDNIDVMLARMHGWEVITVKNLWVKHLRPTAYKYRSEKARKLGEYYYNIGLDVPLAAVSALKSALKNRSAKDFFITMKVYLQQKSTRKLAREEVAFIRKLRYQQLFRLK